jgi:DEAD/DEAH box helicase domain-containing protein
VGRSGQESTLVLIAGEDALDQYFMRHPEDFFNRGPEAAVINPHNTEIMSRHIICAAAELPLKSNEPFLLDEHVEKTVFGLEESGALLKSGDGTELYSSRLAPHRHVDLRGTGNRFHIVTNNTGKSKGEIDEFRAFKETHPGAIYLHKGDTFLVNTLDLDTKTVRVSKAKVDYYTRVRSEKNTEILEIYDSKSILETDCYLGRLKVTDQVTGYEKWRIHAKKKLSITPLNLPPLIFETEGLWFIIPVQIQRQAEAQYFHFMGGIHAIEHAAIGIFPLLVMADRNDLGGISTVLHPQVGTASVFIYDGVPGGAGLCRQAFKKASELIENTFKVIHTCPCETGCPSCVHSPKCGSGNRPIDKASAIFLLDKLISAQDAALPETCPSDTRFKEIKIRFPEKTELFRKKRAEMDRGKRFAGHKGRLRKRMLARRRAFKEACKTSSIVHAPINASESRFCIFDIETQRSAEEVGGWHRADLMKMSCAVLYDSKKDQYFEFLEDQVDQFIQYLKKFDLIVGFNIKRFDFRVLSGYSDFDFEKLPTLDILEEIYNRLGYRLSLDRLAKVTLGQKKIADGLQALQWWKQGRIREIIDYCKKDVEITRDLFLYGQKNGYLLFTNKAKKTVRIPVTW